MKYIEGSTREQVLLFPEVVEEYITEDNPVRFIDVFVGGLDFKDLGFMRAEPAETGRPGYHPGDLMRLYIYGYLNRIRSSRLLEKEAQRNVEVMWLIRKLRPDFKTIADFRKGNLEAIKKGCREFTLLCKRLELFGGELVGIDGSKFRAVNSKSRNFNEKKLQDLVKRIDEKIGDYLNDLDQSDRETGSFPSLSKEDLQDKIDILKQRKGKYRELLKQMEQDGANQVSLTDPESRLMGISGQAMNVSYNVQIAVDAKHRLIVEQEVVNDGSDQNQLSAMAIRARETLGVEKMEVVADKGYCDGQEIKKCQDARIQAYVPRPEVKTLTEDGLYGKEQFIYDTQADCYRCPAGEALTLGYHVQQNGQKTGCYTTSVCQSCPLRSRCTSRKKGGRRIKRTENEGALEAMSMRMKARPEKIKLRKTLCEHPFGTLKRWMNAGHFLMKGLSKVRAEMSLSVLTYNLKRVINILGIPKMMEALA